MRRLQQDYGCVIGADYLEPIVNLEKMYWWWADFK